MKIEEWCSRVWSDKFWNDEKIKKYLHNSLQFSVFFSLVACLITFGIFSYMLIWWGEDTIFRDNFNSTSQELSEKILSLMMIVAQDGDTLAELQAIINPVTSDWPYAYINGFLAVAGTLKTAAPPFGGVYVLPIVHPENVSSFETYVKEAYADDPAVAATAAVHDFGFGISAINESTSERYHCVDSTGKHNFLTPIMAYQDYYDEDNYLWNPYSNYNLFIKGVDGVIDCVQAGNSSCQAILESDNSGPIPGALVVTPISPLYSPNDTVGFVVTAFTWSLVLRESLSSLANNMYLVISTNDEDHFTTRFHNGMTTIEGLGDLHDREYDMISHEASFSLEDTQAAVSVTYNLKLYPTREFYHKFHTSLPVVTTTFTVVMIVTTVIFFFFYDRFMKKESLTKALLLDVKRQFVRFISHEIRSPLNSALLGLKLLDAMLLDELKSVVGGEGASVDAMTEMRSLGDEVALNTDVALVVLNDLLHYDKVEMGNMRLEVDVCDIWRLILDNVYMFGAQSSQSGINLKVVDPFSDSDACSGRKNLIGSLHVRGDGIRLAQAIRNLVSNALKFSENGTSVEVTMVWKEHGLPGVTLPSFPEGHFAEHSPTYRRGSMLLSVSDQGPGMTAEELKCLFGEGVQFQVNKLQSGGGSGLGLHISKGIVNLHGGEIWAQSEGYTCGSTFFIELPLCGNDMGPPPPSSSKSSTPEKGFPLKPHKSLKIFPHLCTGGSSHDNYSPLHRSEGAEERGFGDLDGADENIEMKLREESPVKSCRGEGFQRIATTDDEVKRGSFYASEDEFQFQSGENSGGHISYHDIETEHGLRTVEGDAADCVIAFSSPNERKIRSSSESEMKERKASRLTNRLRSVSAENFTSGQGSEQVALSSKREVHKELLLVDDAASTRKILGKTLMRKGFVVSTAGNGQECLDLLASGSEFTVILMDSSMPKVNFFNRLAYCIINLLSMSRQMSGLEASSHIRELYGPSTIIIGVTGNVMSEDIEAFLKHGADAVLPKPFDMVEFLSIVDRLLMERAL